MSDSDNGSAGSVAHAHKARKGQDGQVAKLRNRFEQPMSQALTVVPARRSARVASAGQPQQTGKRCRSSAQPSTSGAPAASSAADPSAHPPTGLPADPSAVPPADALADLLARIGALEQNQAESQQLRSDLLQTQTELAATRSELLKAQTELTAACSDLAEFKGSVNKRLGEQTSHSTARETAVKDGLQQQVNAEKALTWSISHYPSPFGLFSHIGRPGSGKRAVLVEFSTHTAKHEAFKLSPHLRCSGLHLADELTPKQLKAQKGLEADFSALKLKGFRPFYRRGELKYRDQGVNRTCKRGDAIRVSAPISPPGPLLPHLGLLLGALLLAVRVYALCRQGVRAQAPQLVGALPLVRVRPLRPLLLLLLLPRHRDAGPFLGAWR
ncbi:TPA: hypothetical protein ACH3X1_011713 [Trebouxia sp. C0004]